MNWIDVNKKPDFDGYFLCFVLYPQECGNVWKRQEVIYLDNNEWIISRGTITHWMPLPDLPPCTCGFSHDENYNP